MIRERLIVELLFWTAQQQLPMKTRLILTEPSYLITIGCTATPGAKAPDLNGINARRLVQVPAVASKVKA